MAKPPPTPPSSDIQGVNRDARAGAEPPPHPDAAGAVDAADKNSAGLPNKGEPAGA